ncbi:MAG TPA: hypothetical protein GX519_03115 [Thermoanaerobacterales bacterium]|jgi:hypothetical protein|nr:hypothetical protein [Thermoanaerobacterales bacterium]
MKTFSVSDSDLQLLKAIRPFMSGKSQELLDLMLTTINIFRPEHLDQKINFDALNTLLTMINESIQAKKSNQVIEVDEYEQVSDIQSDEIDEYTQPSNKQSEDVENLLSLLAKKEKSKH